MDEKEMTDDATATFLINEVSARVGLSQKRIRDYEKSGLIKPRREARTNNRRYSEADIQQILRVKDLIHAHGFTLACLRYFLSSAPCWIIFGCGQKETCPTYTTVGRPCYEMITHAGGHHDGRKCINCPVYLNRGEPRMALLDRP